MLRRQEQSGFRTVFIRFRGLNSMNAAISYRREGVSFSEFASQLLLYYLLTFWRKYTKPQLPVTVLY